VQALLCDVCNGPMSGEALELHVFRGQAVKGDGGSVRIAQRGGASQIFMCESCGTWMHSALDHLRRACLQGARG
jgi:hypothetical protein